MPSSYTSNLGIELPSDGELDGVWGDVVNDNMSILDRAINGSVSLTLSGTASTLTTTDGSLSDGQYKLITLSGIPSGTHTITIAPNDAQKIYFVRNTTAQSVVFTQGSGGDVTLASGDSGIIYSNGGGSAAAVVNLTDHFAMSSVKITGGTITGITDLAVADGGTGVSTLTGLVKGNGTSPFSAAVAGTDYQAVITGAATTITDANLTASRALASDGSGKVAVSAVTATELGYLSGTTSAIQTQLNTKAPSASPTLTTPTLGSAITITGGSANWTVTASGTTLTFAYNGVNKMRLDSSGNLTVTGNVTAYGGI